jgi:hypothetical protein
MPTKSKKTKAAKSKLNPADQEKLQQIDEFVKLIKAGDVLGTLWGISLGRFSRLFQHETSKRLMEDILTAGWGAKTKSP